MSRFLRTTRPSRARRAAFVTIATLSAVFFGCAVGHDDGDASESEIKGSLAHAKACGIKSAYELADLGAFQHLTFEQLPSAVRASAQPGGGGSAYAKFFVSGVGEVFVVDVAPFVSFYDAGGNMLTRQVVFGASGKWELVSSINGPDASFATRALDCASSRPPQIDASAPSETSTPTPRPDASLPDPPPDASLPDPPPDASLSE